jgi:hypothetical protein
MTVVIGHECSSLQTNKRDQCDYACGCSKWKAVETTAASNDHRFELADDATASRTKAVKLASVTEA